MGLERRRDLPVGPGLASQRTPGESRPARTAIMGTRWGDVGPARMVGVARTEGHDGLRGLGDPAENFRGPVSPMGMEAPCGASDYAGFIRPGIIRRRPVTRSVGRDDRPMSAAGERIRTVLARAGPGDASISDPDQCGTARAGVDPDCRQGHDQARVIARTRRREAPGVPAPTMSRATRTSLASSGARPLVTAVPGATRRAASA